MRGSHIALLILFFQILSCTTRTGPPVPTPEKAESSIPASDSTQVRFSAPDTIFLIDVPKPKIIQVPSSIGGYYFSADGEQVNLEPPASQLLQIMKNEKGEVMLDENKIPFILGEGGKSQFKTYTTNDGLPTDAINCSIIDSRGHLWFGTNGGGVSRYDGTGFTNYTIADGLAGNNVRGIIEDKNGNIWFATIGDGVSRYDGKRFLNYLSSDGLADNVVYSVTEDDEGNIWFGTRAGVSRFDGNNFKNFTTKDGLVDDVVICVLKDKGGNLWFGTNGNGISRYDGTGFKTFSTEQGLANNRVRSLFEDKSGKIWFGTIGGGVSSFDGTTFKTYTTANGLASDVIRSIGEDSEGNIWFATDGGVSRFDGRKFTSYTTDQGLAGNLVLSITKDRTGKLWFGTDGGGLSLYDGAGFISYTTSQGLGGNLVLSIAESKNNAIWFGTVDGGVSRYDGRAFTTFTTNQGLANDVVFSVTEDSKGLLWFGTAGGVSQFDGKTFINYTTDQGLLTNEVWSILEDQSGNLWFGTEGGGVSRFDGVSFVNFTRENGLAGDVVFSILEDGAGNIWFATLDGGVSRFDGKTFTNYNADNGLADDVVFRIAEDLQGNLWFGTEDGLSYLSFANLKKLSTPSGEITSPTSAAQIFKTFTISDGLPDNNILQVAAMPNGKIAIGTNLGVALFDGPENSSEEFNGIKNLEIFNTVTGYPVKDLTDGQDALFVDIKGILWAGTGSDKTALVRFDYAALLKNQELPELTIQQLRINEEPISWYSLAHGKTVDSTDYSGNYFSNNDELRTFGKVLSPADRKAMIQKFEKVEFEGIAKFYPVPKNLVLPYRHNHINLDYATNELAKPYLIEYQYMLEGYDEEWSPILKKTSATFGNIQEGDYTFKVKARFTGPSVGKAGEWTEPISYNFSVLPPWYRTWWAYLTYGLVFLSLFYPAHRYQRRMVIKAEQEKAKERELAQAKEIEKAYTELKATQTQLIHAEKMASLGELTAGIAHEIQNPLNFVNNFAEVSSELIGEMKEELEKGDLEEAMAIAEDIEKNLGKINHHGKRAGAIVKGMLQHSRSGTGKKEPTDLNLLADEYLRLAFHGLKAKDKTFNADFKTELDETMPNIEINTQDIGRVILNLINNAFYTVNERATQSDASYKPTVTVRTSHSTDKVLIQVTDNGKGIPQAIVDKIFQPFFTTKPTGQGTGLGLSLSYDIVKAHGGQLTVESKEGEGTTFNIQLPLA